MSSNINYARQFAWQDYIDFVDSISAGGANGINVRMHAIENEFDTLSGVVGQVNTGLTFLPMGAGGAVAYTGGSVGVGAGFAANAPPTYGLEVNLASNVGPVTQARFGNAVCSNGGAGTYAGYAMFAHRDHASDTNCALRQGGNGNVHINAAAGQAISFRQNGVDICMAISSTGNVVIGNDFDLPGAGATAELQVAGDAFKATGSSSWLVPSDERLKNDVRDLELGLAELRQIRPVRFRYNGRAGTRKGQAGVGVLGQEIEKIFPEMIRRIPGDPDGDPDVADLRIYDDSALTYVLVNAVKELAKRVEALEQSLADVRKTRATPARASKPR